MRLPERKAWEPGVVTGQWWHRREEGRVQCELCALFGENLGPEVPLHFTAFHPSYRLRHVPATPVRTLRQARQQALRAGLRHVYTGNAYDPEGQSTYCAACGQLVIERDGYTLGQWHLDAQGRCAFCSKPLAGRFVSEPQMGGN